jgi:guanylate kinase
MKKKIKGKIIIISSPSGGGKTSICKKLRQKNGSWDFSVSATTRNKRRDERQNREYKFVDYAKFMEMKKRGDFAESCQVHRYYYGTPRKPLEKILYGGGVMLLDVDVKGADKLKKKYHSAATIFILPPSRGELKKRLKRRGTEDDKHFVIRQKRALSEMKKYREFEYTVINKDLNTAVNEVEMIIKSLHCRFKNLDTEQIGRIIG